MRETWQGNCLFSVQNKNNFLVKATAYVILATSIMILLIMIGGGYMSSLSKETRTITKFRSMFQF